MAAAASSRTVRGSDLKSTLAFTPAAGKSRMAMNQKKKSRNSKGSDEREGGGGRAAATGRRNRGFTSRPSARLDARRTNNPFAKSNSRNATPFGQAYADGLIPARINHGGVKHRLQWDCPIVELDYKILVTFAYGLSEVKHPYTFVAFHGFNEMLDAPGATPKVLALLEDQCLVRPLRAALASKDFDVAKNAISSVGHLSDVVKERLNPLLPQLLVPVKSKIFKGQFSSIIQDILQKFEENGGDEALKAIKAKVPSYSSVLMFE